MSRLITKRPKRAAQRKAPRSYVEVTRIVHMSFNRWEADVEYTYGRSAWTERMSFIRTPRTRKMDLVVIVDSDYPTDRACRIMVNRDMPMVDTITNFVISGRW